MLKLKDWLRINWFNLICFAIAGPPLSNYIGVWWYWAFQ